MTRLIYTSPYTSHSFDQKLLVTSDGGYLFAERGDAYDRGIVISKISSTAKNARSYPSFIPFHFKNGYIYQTTYASLAGIAECSNGYVLAGASEKTLSYDAAKDPEFNESRNIFMQVFSKNFTSSSTNDPNVQLLQGESRIAQGTYVSGTGNCEENAKDYGILWLTDYTGSYYASNPKLISLGEDKLLIMWEKKKYLIDDYWSDQYIEAYYMVVSSDGSVLITQTVIQDERLAQYEEPDYVDGCIYWTTSDGESNNYIVHRLSIGETMAAKIHVSAIKAEKSESVARAGEKTPIEIALTPVDADNKKLKYSNYDSNFIAIDENGYVIVKGPGVTDVTICSEDNENLETTVTVYATDNAPSKVKAINYGEIVKISWNKTKFSQSYEIYRSTRKEKGYEYIGSSDDLKYYDEDVSAGKIYYYKVKASNNWWDEKLSENPYSSPAMICVQTPPEQVAIKKVTSTSLKVTWTKANYATGYEIYYYDEASKKYKLLKTISDNTSVTYKKYGLKSGQTYMFKLRTFKTIDGVNYYSSFSKVLKITM